MQGVKNSALIGKHKERVGTIYSEPEDDTTVGWWEDDNDEIPAQVKPVLYKQETKKRHPVQHPVTTKGKTDICNFFKGECSKTLEETEGKRYTVEVLESDDEQSTPCAQASPIIVVELND